MANATFCHACGSHSPAGAIKCGCCGCPTTKPARQNPVTSAEFANTKLAIFDIDRTILDTGERHRSAVRAGVQSKDFDHTKFTKMSKKDQKKREDFIYREDMLAKDRLIPHSMDLIEHLMKEGYTIAYCTGRAFKHFEKTKAQLEAKGFPLFQDHTGKVLLFLRRDRVKSKGPYKAGVIRTLQAQYDVEFVFDDTVEVLQEAAKLGVPGVYPSIGLYWSMISPRSNPYPKAHVDSKAGGQYVTGTDHPDVAGRAMIDPDDEDGRTVAETTGVDVFTGKPIGKNPIKRGKDSKGTYMRWGKSTGKKYYYKTGNKTSREKARKQAQKQAQAAYAGGYRKNKFSEQKFKAVDFTLDEQETVETNPANPSKVSKGKELYKHMNGKDPAKVEKKTIDIGDVWYQVGEGGCWEIGYCSGKETGSSSQKYIHHFNEETKDGNLPNLYATIPDNGKPMLIITGGTWKIKTDENGVAWIYD